MVCPTCRTTNPAETKVCTGCSTPLDLNPQDLGDVTLPLVGSDADATVALGTQATAWSQAATISGEYSIAQLQAGAVLADRYEIVKLLGEGGMGAVYRAHDRELEREVALKVIRPELARNAQVLHRFKQELILARQVTHRNIIRIFDLGQAEGVRFITMEFIEGEDLSTILTRRGKLPAAEAAGIMAQVARGLEAAHAEGVVHRDLKPQNIMMDASGKVSVMDFGIARSMDASNMTRTGALMGTPTYMSPEQAQGQKVDARSDLYTFGIIFYELLTGMPPFEADNPMATLIRRIQEKPVPPIQVEASIPKAINEMVLKMLGTKADERYQKAGDILADLDAWEAQRTGRTVMVAPATGVNRGIPLKYVVAAMVFVTALGVWLFSRTGSVPAPAAPAKMVRVLVSDFKNATQEAVFDGTLEPTFALALEGASFIDTYSRGDARKALQRIQPDAAGLNESTAQLVAKSEAIDFVVSGGIEKSGSGYNIRAKALDANGKVLKEESRPAADKAAVLGVAGKLAAPIRKALGDSSPERATETYSSNSLEAAQAYAKGQEFQWDLKYAEAIPEYLKAIRFDPEMGRAYAGLATAYSNSGNLEDAEKNYLLALGKTARMTEREQYRTRGAYYLFTLNTQKAVDEFTKLTKQFPADDAGQSNLLLALFFGRNFDAARTQQQALVERNPKKAFYRSNLTLYTMYAGQFEDTIKEAAAAIQMNQSSPKPYLATALAHLAMGRTAEAADSYRKLEAVSARGASFASIGLADMALYEGRNQDAAAILESGIKADLAAVPKSTAAAAAKLGALGAAQHGKQRAVDAASQVLAMSRGEVYSFPAARVLIENGQDARAMEVAKELGARLDSERRAYAKLIEGEIQLKHGKAQAAIDLFQAAQKFADTWVGRLLLGRAYLEAGAFTEASSEFDACEKRKGEATSVFLDDFPTFRYYPQVYYYRGRVQEGLKSPSAGELYKTFLAIKAKSDPDPMVADAQKRAKTLSTRTVTQ
jgi:tetratricopeptide (TPR) repeat protein/predicted Ser/Thr protein kinase